jgi:putative FmdB family regulatory protein
MPIYEYVCDDCKARFERLVLTRSEEIACPKCTSRRYTLQFSTFAARGTSSSGASPSEGSASCACTPSTCGCH